MERRCDLDAIQYLMDVDLGYLDRADGPTSLPDAVAQKRSILKRHIEHKQTELRALEAKLYDLDRFVERELRDQR